MDIVDRIARAIHSKTLTAEEGVAAIHHILLHLKDADIDKVMQWIIGYND